MATPKPVIQQLQSWPPFDEKMVRKKYGALWRNDWNRQKKSAPKEDWLIELECCQTARDAPGPRSPNSKPHKGNRGFEFHFKKLVDCIFGQPDSFWFYEWNPNSEKMLNAFLHHKKLGILGHASSGKSFFLAVLATTLFFIYGRQVKIIITSTTKLASAGKIWGEVTKAWQQIENFMSPSPVPGRNIKSEDIIRYEFNGMSDTTAGVQLLASEQGSDADSAKKIQGYKIDGGFLVVLADELDTLNDSLMETFQSNLVANKLARFIGPFNPTSRSTVAGRFVEPKAGWNSVNEDGPMEWETLTGYAIRFDGLQSPNVTSGQELYKGILTKEAMEEMENRDGGRDSPGFWRNVRAWFSPIGLPDCVYDENEIITYKATSKETGWSERPTLIGGLDTSWTHGGDKCILTVAKVGKCQRQDGKGGINTIKVVEIIEQINLDKNMKLKVSKEEQVTARLKDILKEDRFANPQDAHPLLIQNIALDITGGGNMSPLIKRDIGEPWPVNFNSKPSDKPVSLTDKRKGTERFVNLRDQMWIVPRGLIRSGQLRGMTGEMMKQAIACQFDTSEKSNGGKQSVESKKMMIKRLRHSPDEMDSAIICIHLAIEKFGLVGQENVKKTARPGYKIVERVDLLGRKFEIEVKLPENEWARFREGYKRPQGAPEPALTMQFDGGTYE